MPHFWMSYFQVDNVAETVQKAKALGGKVEIENEYLFGGNIALIRDPQGAGFTVYDGTQLNNGFENTVNTIIGNELHVSNANNVIPFYEGVLGWQVGAKNAYNTYPVFSENGNLITTIQEIDNTFKGKYEYWAIKISVENLNSTKDTILKSGGHLVSDEGNQLLCTDNSGEAFFYIREISS